MTTWPLWQEILVGWGLLTIAPKLLVIPVFRWLRMAVRETERQDLIDAAWLASLDGSGGEGPGGRRWHPTPRRPTGPTRRPARTTRRTALKPTRARR